MLSEASVHGFASDIAMALQHMHANGLVSLGVSPTEPAVRTVIAGKHGHCVASTLQSVHAGALVGDILSTGFCICACLCQRVATFFTAGVLRLEAVQHVTGREGQSQAGRFQPLSKDCQCCPFYASAGGIRCPSTRSAHESCVHAGLLILPARCKETPEHRIRKDDASAVSGHLLINLQPVSLLLF